MIRFLTAGESHGPELTTIIEGFPAGIPFDQEAIDRDLARRQTGYGSGGRMKIEQDTAQVTAGVMAGITTGGPIALHIANSDFAKWKDREIAPLTVPRPGHADLTGAVKYGYRELRVSLERASARETAARVAVGALCKLFLAQFGIQIGSYVVEIGSVSADLSDDLTLKQRLQSAETNDLRAPTSSAYEKMKQLVWDCMQAKDTLGGIFELVALNVPPGLGSHVHWDRRLSAQLLASVGSIQAIKGVEIGSAFANARKFGTQVHDELFLDQRGAKIQRTSNNAGGLEGGITTGEPIILRAAMKPISTVLNPRRSVDLATGEESVTVYERSDFCAVPRAAIVGEAMLAIPLANALIEKLGGDSLEEMLPRFAALRQNEVEALPMNNVPWNFGYR